MKQSVWKDEVRRFSHHAYAIAGDAAAIRTSLEDLLEKELSLVLSGYPDLHRMESAALSIAEARILKERVSRKGATGGKKIFIIECSTVSGEAQNALLKVLEEPSGDSLIFLIVPTLSIFLPTVLSRLMAYTDTLNSSESVASVEARTFIGQNAPERLLTIKKMVDDISDEKRPRQDAIALIRALEESLTKDRIAVKKDPELFSLILRSEQDAALSGASLKMILEQIALRLPS
jgi:hypothetical protein